MKHIYLALTVILFSQMMNAQSPNDSYEALWKKVQQLENEALTKSALTVVETIGEKAKKENNSAQIVKALLYTSKYALILEEDAQLKIVKDFKNQIAKSSFPTKNILESYLANLYWQYFQQNRYQFYNRTNTENKVDSTDFRTWDLLTIFNEIGLHFDNSLQNPEGLQQEKISNYNDVLIQQDGSEILRPSLFDLLAHTALDFYKSGENAITRPADKFEIDNPEYLCENFQFTQLKFQSNDTTSQQLKALQLYQRILASHKENPAMTAFVDVDIARLKYTYQHAVFPEKDQLFVQVLQNSAEQFKKDALGGLYLYEVAEIYNQWADHYQPKTDTTHQWKRKEAFELCEQIITNYPKSSAAEKSKALQANILYRSLHLTSEKHIPVDAPSRLLVNYRNRDSLQFAAYQISESNRKKLDKLYHEPEQLAFIKKLKVVKQWETGLKNEGDYQTHSTEVIVPNLENGTYVIFATPKEKDDSSFAFSTIQVTNLALVQTQNRDNYSFQLINRNNGKPIVGASLQFTYQKNYDNPFLNQRFITDKVGKVSIPLTNENWTNLSITAQYKDETAHFGEYYINQKYKENKKEEISYKSFLFTDRSIYRPGQPLYFKGILLENFKDTSVVASNEDVVVTLYDTNDQEVSEIDVTTNDFGSFQGEFILPNSGLTGEYYIEVYGVSGLVSEDYYFSVEEYKRPRFETGFEPVKETYQVNDSITVIGKATAYAGSAISDAKVVYTVKRVVYFPRWYYWGRMPFQGNPQEIAHGETTSDASGNYNISFKALPDNSSAKENLPVFTYEVTANVTDINGETHSTTTTVRVGYHALTSSILAPGTIDKDKSHKITMTTTNLNGQFAPAKGSLKMYKLQGPEFVLRKRLWSAPDYPLGTETEFKAVFPHDAYANEDNELHWEKGALVWETEFDTQKSTTVDLINIKKWLSGKYLIELETKDKFGNLVTDKTITTLYSEKDEHLADNQLFDIKKDKDEYNIGEKVQLKISSSAKNLNVTLTVEKDKKIVDTHIVQLNNNSRTITLPVTEKDLGGFSINYSFSFYNAFTSGTMPVSVPYPKTDLEIETITFRDKLQPGIEERWTFNIKGPKGDKVAAELLASMYDASLDAFKSHYWRFSPLHQPSYHTNSYSNANTSFGLAYFKYYEAKNQGYSYKPQQYDVFDWFGLYFGSYGNRLYRSRNMMEKSEAPSPLGAPMEDRMELEEVVIESSLEGKAAGVQIENAQTEQPKTETDFSEVQIRTNLQETAFFFPQLRTNEEGNVSFSFTTPEALTKWKLQLLAHTKNLESTIRTLETVTQKELMVTPNAPRFLREGDEITFSSKLANLTNKKLNGTAKIELVNALTGLDITSQLLVSSNSQKAEQSFTLDSLGNTQVSWRFKVPEGIQAIQYKVMAKAGDFSDGEQNVLPVLTNRMLVTETLPMWVKSNESKTFVLDKLKGNTSTTLKNHKLTLEITSNPAWYAVQALPYLMEYPYDCNEQIFSRYYANSLASHIANANPRIREVFDLWATSDALLSTLEKNEELKSLLIQETPWLRDAQSETEQKKRIALLFNLNKMNNEQAMALHKLKNNQMSSGAWAWFHGGQANRFITQHIVSGLGHLRKLNVSVTDKETNLMISKAMTYLDAEFVEEYERMKKQTKNIQEDHLSQTQIHYLYMRSFFKDIPSSKKVEQISAYYQGQAQKYWTKKDLYSKGLLALVLHRMEDKTNSNKILQSLKENSITSDELGMYWKENTASWYWYQAPIETQALLVEAFSEIQNDTQTVDNLKMWLLKNKQTSQWKTTKATTEAVYALLLQGNNWLSVTEAVDVRVGDQKIDPSKLENVKVEAGTGYYKTAWNSAEIQPKMAEVHLSKKGEGIAWGALYWQYFEDLDKITPAKTPLKLNKKLFLKKNTKLGEQLSEITPTTHLNVGDLVRIRIELRADRAMEFVHMKDMRASGLEPINVLSTYKWQDGLGYYESTKDASTNFFFDYLPKGVYVFEYDVRVNNAGDFSKGITTIQSMYAPEFSSHSEGVRLRTRMP
ncbi:MG2 domain-containing protein [Arenibacter sp. GZD96]|uniref:alpha-2-macroglobulin family protein n=1 Tax=Aurantibrevibacter litoralis TaxID=3106030 RepID=UPI002AFF77E7|nr:MG2 domain-containing protein [Arenibacter sp. GZD-96]MEA1785913.1 MG2 domain-containing protein [Arenibacter sp. GZD-96]